MTQADRQYLTGTDRMTAALNLKARYDAGESVRAIAAGTGRSYSTTHQLLRAVKTKFRPRGGTPRPMPTASSSDGAR
ncbi:helix-turn-helix domain-containing protein [Streptomyces roseifaciens]